MFCCDDSPLHSTPQDDDPESDTLQDVKVLLHVVDVGHGLAIVVELQDSEDQGEYL